jgi:phage tail-like protein
MSKASPHYLLNGLAGWRQGSLSGVALAPGLGDDGAALVLQPLPGSGRPLVDAAGSLGGFESAIGVAVDGEDRVYILDGGSCSVKRFDRCRSQFFPLPCLGGFGAEPRQFASPHGMAISSRNDLHIADSGNFRVQVFSLDGLALRAIWGPLAVQQDASGFTVKKAVPALAAPTGSACDPQLLYPPDTWQPWDIAISATNWSYVSDYANGLIHVFDPAGCWHKAFNGATKTQPALVKPTRIALDRDHRLYVLQEGQSFVVVLDAQGLFLDQITAPDALQGRFAPVAVAVDADGNLCLSDCMTRRLYFYLPNGDGSWCGYRCGGCVDAFAASLAFDLSGNPIVADGSKGVCLLPSQSSYVLEGKYYSEALDSRTYRCTWHRVAMRAQVPSGCTIRVDTFTAESAKTMDEVTNLPESRWSTGQVNAGSTSCNWDCLILGQPGRYLWLRLTFGSEGATTPCVEQIKVDYPRASSLQYLPGVYREDAVSADFLSRFLSIFDTLRGQSSELISMMARYFDPRATPANCQNQCGTDFLTWLASWLGLSLDSNWPMERRRALVQQAHRLFDLRGTAEGLKVQIEIFAGVKPRILEMYRLRRWLVVNSATLGNNSTVFGDAVMKRLEVGVNSTIGDFQLVDYGDPALDLFNAYAYRFQVVVPRWPGASDADEQRLQQIIDLAKPAHTIGTMLWAEPRMRIGLQAFLGVDTVIGQYPVGVIEGQGKLGYDTVLGTPLAKGTKATPRVGETSRVGSGTVLN